MMYCHNCGARVAGSEDKYCTTCGAKLHDLPALAADPPVTSPVLGRAETTGDRFFDGLSARALDTETVEEPAPASVYTENERPLPPRQGAEQPGLPLDELRMRRVQKEVGHPGTRPEQPRPLPVEEQRQRLSEEEEKRNARHLEQTRRSTPVRTDPIKPRLREAKGWVPWPETVPEKEKDPESPIERLNRMVPGSLQQKEPETAPERVVREQPAADHPHDGAGERRPPAPAPSPTPATRVTAAQPAPAPKAPAEPAEDPIISWVTPLPISTPEPVKKVPLYEVPQRPLPPPRHPSRPKKGRFGGSGLFEGDGRGIKPSWIFAIAGLIVLTLLVFTFFPVQDPAGEQGNRMKINPLTGGIVNSTPGPTTAVSGDGTGLAVTVGYKGAWSGKIVSSGSIYREIPINGVGTKTVPVNQQSGVVTVQVQKKDDSRESLVVRIVRGTTVLKEGSTLDPSGSLTVTASLN